MARLTHVEQSARWCARKDARETGEQVLKNGAQRAAVQCPSCCCYFLNSGDEGCPDSDCSLGEASYKRTVCKFYNKTNRG